VTSAAAISGTPSAPGNGSLSTGGQPAAPGGGGSAAKPRWRSSTSRRSTSPSAARRFADVSRSIAAR